MPSFSLLFQSFTSFSYLLVLGILLLAPASPVSPERTTSYGVVHGFLRNGTNVWRGIPYAAPPIGDLRLRPPQPPKPWNGTLPTVDFGPACLQMGSPGHSFFPPAWNSINLTNSAEDCLYLNVYAPEAAESLPVMVYLHAGEFRFGGSNDLESNWPNFADGQVILVTTNARLGLFGFAALDDLRKRDPSGSSGNYGMQDQRMALKWVKQNIASFGGDPDKVTIFGESSGGSSVGFHLVSQASKGLFSKVILESPGLTQSKSWNDSATNTKFALSALTAARSKDCKWPSEQQWIHLPGLKAMGHPLAVVESSEAIKSCATRPDCFVMYSESGHNQTTLYGGGVPGQLGREVFLRNETLAAGRDPGIITSIRVSSLGEDAVKCLLAANASDLVNLDLSPPFDDTFYTDAAAPTIDGVELVADLSSLSVSAVPTDIPVLGGSNLDEGTMFMDSLPQLPCNATEEEFAAWALNQYGPEVGAKVPFAYRDVEQPAPLCEPPRHGPSTNTSQYWQAAMRSAGDDAILCRTRDLLEVVSNNSGIAWWYYFTHTPLRSVNESPEEMKYMGAFHGAEVPFVFGDEFELSDDAERKLSKAMGCYWINFVATGNPNVGPSNCTAALSLPSWPTFGQGDALEFATGSLRKRAGLKKAECGVFSDKSRGVLRETLFV